MTRRTLFALPALALRPSLHAAGPGTRSLLDAHNCYPYGEWWADRIDTALACGLPVAIEQDLFWDPERGRSVLAHEAPLKGHEPEMREYALEKIRPLVERELRSGRSEQWPAITLNLDFKTEELEHLRAVRALLDEHAAWLCSAEKGTGPAAMRKAPVLVLVGSSDVQEQVFAREADQIRAFGAVAPGTPLQATAYRCWVNYSWKAVEPEGQARAGAWTPAAEARLRALVRQAHDGGLWIRIYTVNGAGAAERSAHGWFKSYSFGTMEQARRRWQAMADAGVDYIASDQYTELAKVLAARRRKPAL